MDTTQETVQSAITNLKVPGLATVDYWSIFRTPTAIYFVRSGTALGLGVGGSLLLIASVAGDVVNSHEAKQLKDKDLNTILSESKETIRFTPDRFNLIKIKKGLFGGKIIIPNGKEKSWREAGIVKLKLSGKKFKAFAQMLG